MASAAAPTAALDVLGYLPPPAQPANRGAADVLDGGLLAYGAGSAVVVAEVDCMRAACVLTGAHHGAAVTAVKWYPHCHSRDLRTAGHVLLASGDSAGGVVVWDAGSGAPVARLDDVPAALSLISAYASSPAARGHDCGVAGLAWVLPAPGALAVVLSPALLVVWDAKAGALLWKRELAPAAAPEAFTSIAVDPLDSRRVVLTGDAGALLVLRLRALAGGGGGTSGGSSSNNNNASSDGATTDVVEQRQYRVNVASSSGGATSSSDGTAAATGSSAGRLHAAFCAARDVLIVLLPRELLVFDLELGRPAASSPLPPGRPPLAGPLGAFGAGVTHGLGDEGGLDFVLCTHTDGSMSTWVRRPGELSYKCGPGTRLAAPPPRGGGGSGSAATVVAVCCAMARDGLLASADGLGGSSSGSSTSDEVVVGRLPPPEATTRAIRRQLATAITGNDADEPRGGARASSAGGGGGGKAGAAAAATPPAAASKFSGRALIVLAVSTDGRVWHWDLPLPRFPRRRFVESVEDTPLTALAAAPAPHQQQQQQHDAPHEGPPEPVPPQLTGLLHGLPAGVTCFDIHPRPLLLPPGSAPAAAAAAAEAAAEAIASARAAEASGAPRPTYARRESGPGGLLSAASVVGLPASPMAGSGPPSGALLPLLQPGAAGVDGAGAAVAAPQEVVLGAAGTSAGTLDVFVVHRGLINPLAVEPALSLAVHTAAVRGVAFIGALPLVASFSAERGGAAGGGGWRNSVALTCLRSRRSTPFRTAPASDAGPLVGVRASPSGAYLLLLFRGAPAELWASGAGAGAVDTSGSGGTPTRLRYIDLAFADAAWALPADATAPWELRRGAPHTAWALGGGADDGAACLYGGADGAAAQEQPPPQQPPQKQASGVSLQHQLSGLGLQPQGSGLQSQVSGVGAGALPEERLAFALVDGRSGLLTVKGRRVADARPTRPTSGPGPQDVLGTCVAAAGGLIFLGDADGGLLAWDSGSGKCHGLALSYPGIGSVAELRPAPPPCPALHPSGGAGLDVHVRMRLGVLFTGGAFGVFDVDSSGRLRLGAAPPQLCAARAGAAAAVAWLPLPWPVGGGSVLAAALRDGAISLLDTCQSAERRPSARARLSQVRTLLAERRHYAPGAAAAAAAKGGSGTPAGGGGGGSGSPAGGSSRSAGVPTPGGGGGAGAGSAPHLLVGLAPPRQLSSALLMRRPWALLARLVLQLGLGRGAIAALSGPPGDSGGDDDAEVNRELAALLPKGAREQLARAASARRVDDWGFVTGAGWATPPAGGSSGSLTALDRPANSGGLLGFVAGQLGGGGGSGGAAAPMRVGSPLRPQQQQQQQQPAALSRTATALSRADTARSTDAFALLTGGGGFDGELAPLLRHIGRLRARGHLLRPDEWRAYSAALGRGGGGGGGGGGGSGNNSSSGGSGGVADRMAVAARVAGDPQEACFWAHLPATLAAVKRAHAAATAGAAGGPALHRLRSGGGRGEHSEAPDGGAGSQSGTPRAAGAGGGGSQTGTPRAGDAASAPRPGHVLATGRNAALLGGNPSVRVVANGRAARLWDEGVALADAQERALWRDAAPRAAFDAPAALEARVLEYVALGDAQTAVALLLSAAPEKTDHYYRSAAAALAHAAGAALAHANAYASSGGGGAARAATLHVQAAKVLSAHAASIGDTLLGAHLAASAGMLADAAATLQDAGLWRLAATLAARGLKGAERAQALQRWAQHVLWSEGSLWRAVGLLTSAGCLRSALAALVDAGLPDCAAAYAEACKEAGLALPVAASASAAAAGDDGGGDGAQAAAAGPDARSPPLVLFDVLLGSGPLRSARGGGGGGNGGSVSDPACELSAVAANFDLYCSALLQHL